MANFLPFLNTAIRAGISSRAIGTLNPKLKKYFSYAAAAGYGADESIEFLRKIFGNPSESTEKKRLESVAEKGTALPEEKAARSTDKIGAVQRAARTAGNIGGVGMALPNSMFKKPEVSNEPDISAPPLKEIPYSAKKDKRKQVTFNEQGEVIPGAPKELLKVSSPDRLERLSKKLYPSNDSKDSKAIELGTEDMSDTKSDRPVEDIDPLKVFEERYKRHPEPFDFVFSGLKKGVPIKEAVGQARKRKLFNQIFTILQKETRLPVEQLFQMFLEKNQGGSQAPNQETSPPNSRVQELLARRKQLGI